MTLFIYAPNVHQGGGQSLLRAVLEALNNYIRVAAVLDARMVVPEGMAEKLSIRRVNSTIPHRLMAEWWLSKNVSSKDVVLCFGNLPPLFRLRGRVLVFVQNKYLVDKVSLANFPIIVRLRLSIERLWFGWLTSRVDEFIVQTPSMKVLLKNQIGADTPIKILPFVANSEGYNRNRGKLSPQQQKLYDFLYVASGEPHKNHLRLIEAWCLLAADGLFPSLCLTVGETSSPNLCRWIENMKNRCGLNIVNMGMISHDQIKEIYNQTRALIYPSTFESFGLPLIEARQAGLPIVASELDFIRDIIDPEESFDPNSAVSIARAVKRFMKIPECPLPLLNASEFMEQITERRVVI